MYSIIVQYCHTDSTAIDSIWNTVVKRLHLFSMRTNSLLEKIQILGLIGQRKINNNIGGSQIWGKNHAGEINGQDDFGGKLTISRKYSGVIR